MDKLRISKEKKGIKHVNDEAELMRYSNSPFIVTLFAAFQDSVNLYFVMELVQGGDMHTLMNTAREQVCRFSLWR